VFDVTTVPANQDYAFRDLADRVHEWPALSCLFDFFTEFYER
jgi:hypothetical protein